MKKTREPCPAGIEDACPVPRYRCREYGEPGKHCFELFEEFEAFVLPNDQTEAEESPEPDQIETAVVDQIRALGLPPEESE